jgi:hypothetical protein
VAVRREPLTKREEPAKAASPRSNVHNLEFKGNEKIFDITHKKEEGITSSVSKTNEYPPKNPSRLTKTTPLPEKRP